MVYCVYFAPSTGLTRVLSVTSSSFYFLSPHLSSVFLFCFLLFLPTSVLLFVILFIQVIYTSIFCVTSTILLRQLFLLLLPPLHVTSRGVPPRLATKMVSLFLNLVCVEGGLKHLLNPDPATIADPIYGYSSHSQFHFSVAAGYFLYAAGASLIYKGSRVSIFYYVTNFTLCFVGLHPFMHDVGNIFLLSQASNFILDCYGCGVLLGGPRSQTNMTLKFLHPIVFFVTRIVVMVPISCYFVLDLFGLLRSGTAHDVHVVRLSIFATVCINLLNIYWFLGFLAATHIDNNTGVTSVTIGRESMKVKWFAFNLNWFDVGFTLSFGDVQVGTNLKIDNSSYTRATPGFTVPVLVLAVCFKLTKVVEVSAEPFWETMVITIVTIVIVKAFKFVNHRAAKIGLYVTTEVKQQAKVRRSVRRSSVNACALSRKPADWWETLSRTAPTSGVCLIY